MWWSQPSIKTPSWNDYFYGLGHTLAFLQKRRLEPGSYMNSFSGTSFSKNVPYLSQTLFIFSLSRAWPIHQDVKPSSLMIKELFSDTTESSLLTVSCTASLFSLISPSSSWCWCEVSDIVVDNNCLRKEHWDNLVQFVFNFRPLNEVSCPYHLHCVE